MPVPSGTRLGPYEVTGLIATGGMGEVYRASDPRLGRDVAVKLLPAALAADPVRLRRFEREARAVASLNHPNILTVYDVGVDAGVPYVVAELLEGMTLRQLELVRRPSLQMIVSFAVQVARGLDAAHCKGLVHRDLKPENVFVTGDGRAKILDFGIAKVVEGAGGSASTSTEAMTASGSVLGTVAYMSPEQARCLPVDSRSDIFALGVVLYELLSGRHPFARETPVATVAAIVDETPPALSSVLRGIPSALSALVQRCLEKSPDERFRSAHDLALALEAVLQPSTGPTLAAVDDHGPYPGLCSFTERDAGVFFGREDEVKALWEALREGPILGLIGPSAAGKTSFVRAGVIASRPTGWGAIACTPGASPFRALGRALAPELQHDPGAVVLLVNADDPETAYQLVRRWRSVHTDALLVVDQLEELFTLCPPEVQERFAALLERLSREADVHVLLSLRDDFLIRCCEQPGLARVLSALQGVLPLRGDDLRRALVEPASRRGYRFEDESLVDEMLGSVAGVRAPLPLLAFAVSRLWDERDREGKLLTRAAYREVGGVAGALAQHAEATLDRIGAERHGLVRELFRNLVTSQGTRAVADTEELLSAFADRGAGQSVLNGLVDARLLTSYEAPGGEAPGPGQAAAQGRRRVEIVHESLLTAWPRLVQWQAQDQDGAILRDQLRQSARLWEEKGRPADLLWSGTSFREYELWRTRYPGALTAMEDAFARAMVDRARRRKRLVRAGLAAAFVGLAAVAGVIGASRREAVRNAEIAGQQSLRARASKLVALGRLQLDGYPTAAVAYARKSLELADTIEARLLALEALWRGPVVRSLVIDTDCSRIAFSPDGQRIACSGFTQRLAVVSQDGAARSFDLQPTKADARSTVPLRTSGLLTWLPGDDRVRELSLEGRELRSYPGEVHHLRLLPDGTFVTCGPAESGARDRVIRVWRPGATAPTIVGRWSPRPGMRFDQPGVRALDFDPRLRFMAYGWEDGVYAHALGRRAPAEVLVGRHRGRVREVAFDPSGGHLASIDDRGEVRVRAVPGWNETRSLSAAAAARFSLLAFDARGERLAWGTGGEGVLLWDFLDPPDAPPLSLRKGEAVFGRQHAFSPDGRWLAGGGLRSVDFWPLGLRHARVLRGHAEGPVQRLVFSTDSRFLVSCARDGARVWPLTPEGGRQRLISVGGDYMCYDVGVEPYGRDLVVASPFKGVYVVPIEGGEARRIVDLGGRRLALSGIAFDDARHRVAVGSTYAPGPEELSMFVVDLASGARKVLRERAGPTDDPYAGNVEDAVFAPDGSLITGGDGGVKRWNVEEGTATTLYGGPGRFASLAGSRDRRRMVALVGTNLGDFIALGAAETVLFDLERGSHRVLPVRGSRLTHAVALDAAGERLVTGDVTGAVRVGRVSGEEPHLLLGHIGPVTDVAFSPDGKWIASASGSEIRLWPMPDVSKTPFHALPHDALMARLRTLTNLQVVEDAASATGYSLHTGPFPGWKDVPVW